MPPTIWHKFRINEFDDVVQATILLQDGYECGSGPDRFYSKEYYLPDGRDYQRVGDMWSITLSLKDICSSPTPVLAMSVSWTRTWT